MLYELIDYLKRMTDSDIVEYVGEDNTGFYFILMVDRYIYEYRVLKVDNIFGENIERTPLGLNKWKGVGCVSLEKFLIYS